MEKALIAVLALSNQLPRSTTRVANLVCPTCGVTGAARWDTKRSFLHGRRRSLIELSPGFVSVDTGNPAGPQILCQVCRGAAQEQVVK